MSTDTPKNAPSPKPKDEKTSVSKALKEKLKKSAKIAGILGVMYAGVEGIYEYRMEKSVNRVATKTLLTKILEDNTPATGHGLIIYYNPKTGNYDALHYPVDKDEITLPSLMVTNATIKSKEDDETFEIYEVEQKPKWESEFVKLEAPLLKFNYEWSAEDYKITGTDGTKYTIVAMNTGKKWPGWKNEFLFPNASEANSSYSILGNSLDTTKQHVNTTRVKRIVENASGAITSETNYAEDEVINTETEAQNINPNTKPNISE